MNTTVTFNQNHTGRKWFKYAPKRASVLRLDAFMCFQTIRLTIITTKHTLGLHNLTSTHWMRLDYTQLQLREGNRIWSNPYHLLQLTRYLPHILHTRTLKCWSRYELNSMEGGVIVFILAPTFYTHTQKHRTHHGWMLTPQSMDQNSPKFMATD
jgi:hypothetical protein